MSSYCVICHLSRQITNQLLGREWVCSVDVVTNEDHHRMDSHLSTLVAPLCGLSAEEGEADTMAATGCGQVIFTGCITVAKIVLLVCTFTTVVTLCCTYKAR